MDYVNKLFDSQIEEVTPPQLAKALGFAVSSTEPDFDDPVIEALYDCNADKFYEAWNPTPPDGYFLGGKYESDDGAYAFFAKPVTKHAIDLVEWNEREWERL